jgi:hypothetical protein
MSDSSENSLTLEDMERLATDAFDLKASIKTLEDQTSELNKKLTDIKFKMLRAMDAAGLKKYSSSYGNVQMVETYTASLPSDETAKQEVFKKMTEKYGEQFMKAKLTIYAKTLESLVKEEIRNAAEEGTVLTEFFGLPVKTGSYLKIT